MAGVIFDGNTVAPAILVEKEITKTKFGLTIDNLLGDVDENGVLKQGIIGELVGVGIKEIPQNRMYRMFSRNYINTVGGGANPTIRTFSMPDLIKVNNDCCGEVCYGNAGMGKVLMNSLEVIDATRCFKSAFTWCQNITVVEMKKLRVISGANSCDSMFSNCTRLANTGLLNLEHIDAGVNNMYSGCKNLTSTGLENLTTVDCSCQAMFSKCTSLTKEYFPMLTSATPDSFGGLYTTSIFNGCTGITALHFRADMQATIEAMTKYTEKFGATNATIYFDLIGTITVNGVAYARDEKQSIRVDGVKTFVGWKDTDGNVVYTSYAGNAEPAVGTVVYSDAGTTQVGTVEGVA